MAMLARWAAAITMMVAVLSVVLFIPRLYAASQGIDNRSTAVDDFELFSFDGYRLYRYRSPTPQESEYATTLDTPALVAQLQSTTPPLLLDVQPTTWNHIFIQQTPRYHLPGSHWLPNVGAGELAPDWLAYFRNHLARLTQHNLQHPVVIYCTADCWMSWNAVKRAASFGYTQLYWYRNGTDGWAEHERALVKATPVPFKRDGQ